MMADPHFDYLSEVPVFKDLELWKLRRFHYDISVAFKNAFKKPPERPQDRAKRIWKLVGLIRKGGFTEVPVDYSDIWDEAAYGFSRKLAEFSDDQTVSIIKNLKGIASRLDALAKQSGKMNGGPNRNDGVYTVVNRLAMLYQQHTSKRPTHTVPAYNDQLTTDFDQFVEAVFEEHSPRGPIPWGSIENASREVIHLDEVEDTVDNARFFNEIAPLVEPLYPEGQILHPASNTDSETGIVLKPQKQAAKPKQQRIRRDSQGVGAVAGCPGGP